MMEHRTITITLSDEEAKEYEEYLNSKQYIRDLIKDMQQRIWLEANKPVMIGGSLYIGGKKVD